MEDTAEIIRIADKGPRLKTLAKYYIYKESKKGNKINDKKTSSTIFSIA